MNTRIEYYRTFDTDGSQATHLCLADDDKSICGQDTIGDPSIYRKDPEQIAPPCRVTCRHCQSIIDAALAHRKATARDVNNHRP